MPSRRSPGEGSLYYRKSTGRWYCELVLGRDQDGERQTWRFSDKSKRIAIAALQKAQAGKAAAEPQARTTWPLSQYLEYWLESVKTTREPRTYIGYRSIVNQYVTPTLGHVRICDVRPQMIQSLYGDLSERLSPQTVMHVHRCLHRALEVALRWEMIDRNPCHLVDPPHVPRREQTTLTVDQARMLLGSLEGNPLRGYWTIALTTGMRTSEMAGVKWTDLDFEAGRLRVQRTLQLLGGQWTERDTKTHQGRGITLTAIGIAALRDHRVRQAEQRLAAGPRWQDRGLVFTNPTGGVLGHWTRRHSWARLLTQTGLPVLRMYDLRHTAASLLASWGVSIAVISEILGHSSAKMTLETYIMSMPTAQTDAMRTMDERLGQG